MISKELRFLIVINYQAENVIKSNKVSVYCIVLVPLFYYHLLQNTMHATNEGKSVFLRLNTAPTFLQLLYFWNVCRGYSKMTREIKAAL